MLMRTDPFRELDRLSQQVFGQLGTWSRPAAMPMEAYRQGDQLVVHFDLPGVDPESIDVNVERNVLTVKAERRPTAADEGTETMVAERPYGVSSRQLFLGETLDTDRIEAHYDAGVLNLHIPVAE
jgi:HSP20 family protein